MFEKSKRVDIFLGGVKGSAGRSRQQTLAPASARAEVISRSELRRPHVTIARRFVEGEFPRKED